MTLRYALIANPRSAGGRTGARLGELRHAAAALGSFELLLTEGPGHATDLARQAVDQGFDRVVAIGGDGTLSEVVNGLFDGKQLRREGVGFGILNAGTGGDFIKSLGVPSEPEAAFRAMAASPLRPVDLMHLSFTGHDGAPAERIGVNVVGFGLNGEVVDIANRSSKRWGGRATFLTATIQSVRTYKPATVRITWEDSVGGEGSWDGELSAAFVANGQFCGGGMWVGRGTSLDDGWVDLTIIPPLSVARMILGAPRLMTGALERVKGVSRNRVTRLSAFTDSANRIRIDVDGEQPGFLPLSVTVLHKVALLIG
jgi:diacylglycerol kinase (ATP)